MKIMVAIKWVLDYQLQPAISADGKALCLENLKMAMNPFDEVALEQALRWREAGLASEVLAVTCGAAACDDVLRSALAMGADRALRVDTDVSLQPLGVARLLKTLVLREAAQVVLLGKQASDDDAHQTGQMLAAMLGWPQATCVSAAELQGDELLVTREIEGGQEQLALTLPAVITADLRLAAARFVSLPGMMRARRQPLELLSASELADEVEPRLQTLGYARPAVRPAGERLSSVRALVERLRSRNLLDGEGA